MSSLCVDASGDDEQGTGPPVDVYYEAAAIRMLFWLPFTSPTKSSIVHHGTLPITPHHTTPPRSPGHPVSTRTMAFLEVAVLPLRAVQALFSIIVLGLTAYIVDAYTNPWASWSPHSVNFMLFTAVWTLLAVAYLVLAPTRFPRAAHKFAILGVEALTMLFWFAAWVAVAALWGDWWRPARNGSIWSTGVAAIIFSAFIWYVSSPRGVFGGECSDHDAGLPLLPRRSSRHCTSAARQGATLHRRRR
jgi:hypothetical protein